VVGRAIKEPSLRREALAVLADYAADGGNLRDVARLTAALGDREGAITYLLQAREVGWPLNPEGVDPAIDRIRDDPRVIRLFADLGLPNGYEPTADTLP